MNFSLIVQGERVHVIQAPPLIMQPVIFGRCETESSSILDAKCQQVMLVMLFD